MTAFTAALLIVWWLSRGRLSTRVLDHPNARSLHGAPVPRTGGIGLHAGVLLALSIVSPGLSPAFWAGYGALLLISFLDDVRGVPSPARLAVHLAAAGYFAWAVVVPGHGAGMAVIVALGIAWMVNLYNFMDGADGLAGGMAVIGFLFFGVAASLSGNADFALVNLSVAAAAAAFLVFNLHPARIFMGDAGSVPLGFLAAALGIIGWQQGDWTLLFPVLVFAPFIVDASVTLARRLARRDRVWEAHRDHYYQRLVRLGWGHRRTALAEYAVMAASGLSALATVTLPAAMQAAALVAIVGVYLVIIALIERAWHRRADGDREEPA